MKINEQTAAFIKKFCPIYPLCDIQLLASEPLSARCKLTPNEINSNHVGTAHAGMQWMMMEMIGGIIGIDNFDMSQYILVVRNTQSDFMRPAKGEITAYGRITEQGFAQIKETLTDTGKADFEVDVELSDENNVVVGRSKNVYQLRSINYNKN